MQGHAFANRFSRNWSFPKEDNEGLGGDLAGRTRYPAPGDAMLAEMPGGVGTA